MRHMAEEQEPIASSVAGHESNSRERFGPSLAGVPPQLYPAGVALLKQGHHSKEVYLIEKGLVKLIHSSHRGKEFIIGVRSSGRVLGADSIILGVAYPATAVTLTPCSLVRVPANTFLESLASDPSLSLYVQYEESREAYEGMVKLCGFACLTARERLEQLLYDLALALSKIEGEKPARFQLPLRHWEMAELISVTPQ
ncbi:MAG TPA: Crp/Fnr family transcriptional regulator, partial [Blastocatellia bacterium]|nr:Crp/Fnr family transcriptional regulator [Blastocatellia bacterium]